MRLRKESRGDIDVYTRPLVKGDKKRLLKELNRLAKSKDPEEAHDTADNLLVEFLDDEEIARAFNNVPRWYA